MAELTEEDMQRGLEACEKAFGLTDEQWMTFALEARVGWASALRNLKEERRRREAAEVRVQELELENLHLRTLCNHEADGNPCSARAEVFCEQHRLCRDHAKEVVAGLPDGSTKAMLQRMLVGST